MFDELELAAIIFINKNSDNNNEIQDKSFINPWKVH